MTSCIGHDLPPLGQPPCGERGCTCTVQLRQTDCTVQQRYVSYIVCHMCDEKAHYEYLLLGTTVVW